MLSPSSPRPSVATSFSLPHSPPSSPPSQRTGVWPSFLGSAWEEEKSADPALAPGQPPLEFDLREDADEGCEDNSVGDMGEDDVMDLSFCEELIDLSSYDYPDLDVQLQLHAEHVDRIAGMAVGLDSWTLLSSRVCMSGLPVVNPGNSAGWCADVRAALSLAGLEAVEGDIEATARRGRGGMINIGDSTGDIILNLTRRARFEQEARAGALNRVTSVDSRASTVVITGIPEGHGCLHVVAVLRGCPVADGPSGYALGLVQHAATDRWGWLPEHIRVWVSRQRNYSRQRREGTWEWVIVIGCIDGPNWGVLATNQARIMGLATFTQPIPLSVGAFLFDMMPSVDRLGAVRYNKETTAPRTTCTISGLPDDWTASVILGCLLRSSQWMGPGLVGAYFTGIASLSTMLRPSRRLTLIWSEDPRKPVDIRQLAARHTAVRLHPFAALEGLKQFRRALSWASALPTVRTATPVTVGLPAGAVRTAWSGPPPIAVTQGPVPPPPPPILPVAAQPMAAAGAGATVIPVGAVSGIPGSPAGRTATSRGRGARGRGSGRGSPLGPTLPPSVTR